MNNGDQALSFIYLILCLILVASGLMVRRLPIAQSLKMVLAWTFIFAAVFAAIALKDEFYALGGRMLAEVRGGGVEQGAGGEVRIRRASDGHFWVNGELNGRSVRFLVDSGATVTTITRDTATRAGVAPDGGFGVMVDTANGTTMVERGRARTLKVGSIERGDVAVHISETLGDTNVIGMNFLSSLASWGVEGTTLVLRS